MAVKAAKYSGAILTDFAIASSINVGEGLKLTHFLSAHRILSYFSSRYVRILPNELTIR